jgi:hypothetical protein
VNPDQINCRAVGPFPVTANVDLTGKRSRLVVLVNNGGNLEAKLPTANGEDAFYQVQEEGAATEQVSIERFGPHRDFRVPLKGACNPGARLVLADTAVAGDRGALRTLPAAAGTYRVLAIAREAGVDTQHVKCDPVPAFDVVVP